MEKHLWNLIINSIVEPSSGGGGDVKDLPQYSDGLVSQCCRASLDGRGVHPPLTASADQELATADH